MLTMKPERAQGDGKGDKYSDLTATDPGEGDLARQEFKLEADINHVLRRFGVDGTMPPMRQGEFGVEVDYDYDFQAAMNTIAGVEAAYRRLSPEIKEKYPTWQLFLAAIERGEIVRAEEPAPTAESEKQKNTDSAGPAGS